MQDDELEPAELKGVVEVVTTAKLMTEVVTAASATISDVTTLIIVATITTAPSAARRRKGVDEAYARELEAELNKNINWDEVIEQVQRKEKEENVVMRALKRKTESQAEKAAKKQKLDKEVEELKRHLQIVPNDEDVVYTEATSLARKVPVVDYEIYT
nr:hypothetical protein [Tanacetum cinerariifolium]